MMTAILESIVGRLPGLTVACLLDEDEGELPQLTCITKGSYCLRTEFAAKKGVL